MPQGRRCSRRLRYLWAQPQAASRRLSSSAELARAYIDETGAPTGNADGGNPDRKRGWQWVMVTPVATVFLQGLSRSAAAAVELLGTAFSGIAVSDRFSAYNHLPVMQRQLCWAHLIRDLTAIAERQGVSGEIGLELLALQQQLFVQWHQWKDGTIDWDQLQQSCRPIRHFIEASLERVVELGFARKERTPWAQTVRTCQKLLQHKEALWTFLVIHGVEPTNTAVRRHRKLSQRRHEN